MSFETPRTVREAKMLRGNAKRKITNLVKDGLSLLQSDEGIPCDEYKLLADMIREHLDTLQVTIDHVIKFKCEELKVAEYKSEEDLDNAEQEIAMVEQAHFCEAQDNAMPIVRDLIRRAKRLLDAESPTIQPQINRSNQPVSSHARLAKLKFATFSGDLRDYKLFKKQFLHYSQHLDKIECFYQLVESIEKVREKNKIKSCISTTRAWEILDEFYGDDDQIVETLLGDLERMTSHDTKGHINISAMEKFVEAL
ncbi:hypothetical protein LOTGIDRAFT_152007 [Lottia gigantea]|uniref:Uncharacterized protein n=1 Tax=Lottia gigantea TaxID=225164 RepID=V4BGZ3_LOTGI|nr:hypothetical protein LOTGIDRAFT_152007 [Lottia gigantea]ESP05197.1 hypothetical protein LOTGIDRAFT_152007 [Lottia gigantea]